MNTKGNVVVGRLFYPFPVLYMGKVQCLQVKRVKQYQVRYKQRERRLPFKLWVDFHYRIIFACECTRVKFTCVNEKEAMHERPREDVNYLKLSDVQLLRLRVAYHTVSLFISLVNVEVEPCRTDFMIQRFSRSKRNVSRFHLFTRS